MDLAVVLPLAFLFVLQLAASLLLLAPRAISAHVAAGVSALKTNTVAATVLHTTAVAVLLIMASSGVQLASTTRSMALPQYGDRTMALTVEELRAALAAVLGAANLVLLFLNPALAAAQQAADKAALNLAVLQKQAKGLQSEYMRATTAQDGKGGAATSDRDEVSKLIAQKQRLQDGLEAAQGDAAAAAKNLAAVKAQAQGLEREYDRLLAENDALKKRLSRLGDAQFASAADKKSA